MRRKKVFPIVLLTIIITVLVMGGIGFYLLNGKNAEIAELRVERGNEVVCIFANDKEANSLVTDDDIDYVVVKRTELANGVYQGAEMREPTGKTMYGPNGKVMYMVAGKFSITDDGEMLEGGASPVGRRLKTKVYRNTQITDSLLLPEDGADQKTVRMEEFNYISLPSTLGPDDYIDVRIAFPTGEDYIVLASKKVQNIQGVDTVFLKLNEAEILAMASATVEAFMNTGTKLYATKYTDAYTQLVTEQTLNYVEMYDRAINEVVAEESALEARKLLAARSGDQILTEVIGEERVATQAAFEALNDTEKARLLRETNISASTVDPEKIALKAGIPVDVAKAIQEAKKGDSENADSVLNSYKNIQIVTVNPVAVTYPIKAEVQELFNTNPNLLEQMKQSYARMFSLNTRSARINDEYLTLVEQYKAAPFKKDLPYGSQEKSKEDIQSDIDTLLNTRAEAIQENIENEIARKRALREQYLTDVLGYTVTTGEE